MNYSSNTTNISAANSSPLACTLDIPDTAFKKAWKTGIYCVIILVSLVGNALVLIVVYKKQRMRTTTNFLIVNMAASDLLIAIFAMPPTVRSIYSGEDLLVHGIMAQLICKLVTFFQQVSIAVSVLSLTAIAFDRFFAIVFPFRQVITVCTTKLIIVLTWLVGVTWAAPILYTNRILPQEEGNKTVCREIWEPLLNSSVAQKDYTIVTFSFFYAGPLVIMTILYTAIVVELWRGNSIEFRTRANHHEIERSNRKVLNMVVTVVIIFALFWLPVYIFQFAFYLRGKPCAVPFLVQFFGYFLCQATSAVNPLIFAIFSENYRQGFKQSLQILMCCHGKRQFQNEQRFSTENGGNGTRNVELYIL